VFNSGSEAVENADQIARTYTPASRPRVLDHPNHAARATMALTAKSMPTSKSTAFRPVSPEI